MRNLLLITFLFFIILSAFALPDIIKNGVDNSASYNVENNQLLKQDSSDTIPDNLYGKKIKKKPDYICEVHFFDGTYKELKSLESFTGNAELVQRITIQNQGIINLPKNLENFKKVRLLDLSHNKIEHFDIELISEFKELEKLYLNSNSIPAEEIKTLKSQLANIQIFSDEDVRN